jgi:hypothetical protein
MSVANWNGEWDAAREFLEGVRTMHRTVRHLGLCVGLVTGVWLTMGADSAQAATAPADQSSVTNAKLLGTTPTATTAENVAYRNWRYRYHNGRWWYWSPNNYWLYYGNNGWHRHGYYGGYGSGYGYGYRSPDRGYYGYRGYPNRGYYGYRGYPYRGGYGYGRRYGTGYRGYNRGPGVQFGIGRGGVGIGVY